MVEAGNTMGDSFFLEFTTMVAEGHKECALENELIGSARLYDDSKIERLLLGFQLAKPLILRLARPQVPVSAIQAPLFTMNRRPHLAPADR